MSALQVPVIITQIARGKWSFAIFLSLCSLYILTYDAHSQNPLVKDVGMSDPHIRIFNDTVYLYCGHDASPEDKTWVMKNWRVYSSTNLKDWSLRETISPENNYMDDNSTDCWASDAATRNGKYYFYFSDRKRSTGVMVSESPTGPFKDALGQPLVAPGHDPTILIDDDENQTPYIVYGDKNINYHVARLNDDMISLAEQPKPIKIIGEAWEKAPEWMDKNYIFKHNGLYYLSWGQDYATSENIYGPYRTQGKVGEGHHLNKFAHGSFFWWKGQFYHTWCYYIKNGYKYRETIMTYCHIDDNGRIVTDTGFLDKHFAYGVGRYDAKWDTIQAEWYYEISEGIDKTGDRKKGFVLTDIEQNDWVRFANVDLNSTPGKLFVRAFAKEGNGLLEIRSDSHKGALLGKVKLPAGKVPSVYQIKLDKNMPKATSDLYLVFKANRNISLELDWIRFE